jgi:hypothetical protein
MMPRTVIVMYLKFNFMQERAMIHIRIGLKRLKHGGNHMYHLLYPRAKFYLLIIRHIFWTCAVQIWTGIPNILAAVPHSLRLIRSSNCNLITTSCMPMVGVAEGWYTRSTGGRRSKRIESDPASRNYIYIYIYIYI